MQTDLRYAPLFRFFSLIGVTTFLGMAFIGWMAYRVEGETMGFWLMWPFLVIGLAWLLALAAAPRRVVFGSEALTIVRWLGRERLAYREITAVSQSYTFITLKTLTKTIRLYKLFANDDAKLITALEKYVPIAQQARARRISAKLPLQLKGNWTAPIFSLIGSLLLAVFCVGAIQFGILNPVESGVLYQLVMAFFALFAAAIAILFLYMVFWQYPHRTIFTADSMVQQHLLHTTRQPMAGIIAFTSGSETRTVRGVKRQLHYILFHYHDGSTFKWIPHEFDFPVSYIDAAAANLASEWLERLQQVYLLPEK